MQRLAAITAVTPKTGMAFKGNELTAVTAIRPVRAILRAALLGEVDLPAANDEVHQLLKQFGFTVPLGHLDQAIGAHTRGN